MNINVSPPRKAYGHAGTTAELFRNHQVRLQNILTPVIDALAKSPLGSTPSKNKAADKVFATLTTHVHRNTLESPKLTLRVKKLGGALFSSKRRLNQQEGKRVHFACNKVTGGIAEAIYHSKIVLTDKDIERAWLSRKELRNCRFRAQETCRFYLESRPDYQDALLRLLVRCGATPTEEFVEEELLLHDTYHDDEESDVSIIVGSEARGLEKRLLNNMDLPFHRHKFSIEAALGTQQRLLDLEEYNYFTADKRMRLIASQYGLCARYATTWARLIAVADAQEVEQGYHHVSA